MNVHGLSLKSQLNSQLNLSNTTLPNSHTVPSAHQLLTQNTAPKHTHQIPKTFQASPSPHYTCQIPARSNTVQRYSASVNRLLRLFPLLRYKDHPAKPAKPFIGKRHLVQTRKLLSEITPNARHKPPGLTETMHVACRMGGLGLGFVLPPGFSARIGGWMGGFCMGMDASG
jgi:hypothetical protein